MPARRRPALLCRPRSSRGSSASSSASARENSAGKHKGAKTQRYGEEGDEREKLPPPIARASHLRQAFFLLLRTFVPLCSPAVLSVLSVRAEFSRTLLMAGQHEVGDHRLVVGAAHVEDLGL